MISVIICTHNPRADYLARAIEGLKSQTLAFEEWEWLLIDNASDPEKKPEVNLSWHPRSRLIVEAELGLTPARLRGIREARGDLLVFVDDDNILDAHFLSTATRIANEKPFLGSWSGQCQPVFEAPPPNWTRRYWGNLVIREFEDDQWSNLPRLAETMACGAGLCVRKEVADHYLHLHETGQREFQFDRTGSSLLSAGDNDLAACACDVGLGTGIISSLMLKHLIPPERLTVSYMSKLVEGIYFSGVLLDSVRRDHPTPFSFKRTIWEWIRSFLVGFPHGQIQRSTIRGRWKARRLLRAQRRTVQQSTNY